VNRPVTVARIAVLFAFVAACARAAYTCVNPAEVPGACQPDTVKHGAFKALPDSSISTDSVVGQVFSQLPGNPIGHARVTITSDSGRTYFTDSTGRFAAPRPATQSWTVRAQMIGYRPRTDTIRAPISPVAAGVRLRIELQVQPLDGECGDYLICTKRR
jgi:hypothetical protein